MDDFGNDIGHYFYPDESRTTFAQGWVQIIVATLVSLSAYGGTTFDKKVDA